MKPSILGGVLLIAGTSIGGGMLGLPIATAQGGIWHASLLFIGCWALMAFTAMLTLEVNMCFPRNSNVISMAKATLGTSGALIGWTIYLFFLYALVSAYIAGGQDLLHGFLERMGITLPLWVCGVLFVFLFGAIVIAGIKQVDYLNRLLMLLKLVLLVMLMAFIAMHIRIEHYHSGQLKLLLPAITVAITSFGFSIIVPTLRYYYHDNIRQLRWVIILGSLIPLFCYIMWDAVIFGLIPLHGQQGLGQLIEATQPVSGLLASIGNYVPGHQLLWLASGFTSICILTAFACVSLGLSDYLADGLRISPQGAWSKWLLFVTTFFPPLMIVVFYPKAFIALLSFAGLCCVMLQALLPALMAWRCRYVKKIDMPYQVVGGKPALILTMVISLLIMGISTYQLLGFS